MDNSTPFDDQSPDCEVALPQKTPSGHVNLCWRVSLFILAGILILLSPVTFMAVLGDSLSFSEGSGRNPVGYEYAGFAAIAIGILAGVLTCIATARANYRTVLAWTIALWGFTFIFVLDLIFTIIGGTNGANRRVATGTCSFVGVLTLIQLITTVIFTPLTSVRYMRALRG